MSHDREQFSDGKSHELQSVPEPKTSSEQMLRLVLDNIPQGVFWKDRQSCYLGCNLVVSRTFGLASPEAIVGLDDRHLRGLTCEQAEHFIAQDRSVMANDKPELGVIEKATLADGSTIWLETNKFPKYDDSGAVNGIFGTFQDVTSRMQSEATIRERESQLEIFVEHAPVALAMFDREMRYLHASGLWKSVLNLGERDLRGLAHYEVTQGIPERWKEIHRRALAGEVMRADEDRFEMIDGTTLWLRWEVRPWFDNSGSVGGILIFTEEITDRKRGEEDRARLAAIVESSEDAIISKSLDGTISSWNAGAERLFGYTPQEAIGQSITLIVPQDRMEEEDAILARLARGERLQHFETVRRTKDGRRLDFSLTISPIRNKQGQIVAASKIARDITFQKQSETALHQREALLRSATDNAAVGLVMLDRNRRYIFVNASYPRILDLPWKADEIVGKSPAEILASVYTSQIAPQLDRAFAGENVTYELARPCSRSDREGVAHYVVVYDPMFDGTGVVDNVIVTIFDITAREQAEAALRESEERLGFALESSQIGMWDLNLVDHTVFRSLEHDRIFGYEELLDEWNYELFLEHVIEEDREQVNDIFTNAVSAQGDWNFECRIRRADDQIRWIWAAGRHRIDTSGVTSRIVGVVQDVTARKQSEEERQKLEAHLRHVQKLESLGVLAGGIAHDFNNVLTSILGYSDLALIELPSYSPARPLIAEAVNGARKAADLTRQMLAYSGKGKFVVDALNLNDVIEDMVHLLQVSISKKCVLKLHLMPALPSIEADAVQMRQVIMNLIINASDAIGDRSGVIAIITGVMHCDRAYLSESYLDENLAEGPYVYLEIADTGCGMSEETRARIFDPFFTTKTTGRGLGLAAVLGIVRGHRGALKVYSEVGKGTTFKVAFPATDLSAQAGPASGTADANWRGSGTVLIVDDEEAVRGLVQCMLEMMGFTVLSASDGRAAVDLFRREGHAIRLVILDMTMPHLDGAETFRELRRIRSDVMTILTSGYNEQSAISQFAGKGLAGFIQKPFRYEELLAVVRKIIGG